MSNGEGKDGTPERQGFQALERAVTRALDELTVARARAAAAERRSDGLEALLKSFETGEETASGMKQRLLSVDAENRDLRSRVEAARQTVERLLARISFLENQK